MSLETWVNALEEIPLIIAEEPTKDKAVLLASLFTLESYFNRHISRPEPIVESVYEEPTPVDYVPNSRIDELMQDKLQYFIEYMKQKGLEQTTNSPTHGDYAETALKKMLDLDYEIAQMLLRTADHEEQEYIRQAYERISKL